MNGASVLGIIVIVGGLLLFGLSAFTCIGGWFGPTQSLEAITWENWSVGVGSFGWWRSAGMFGLFLTVFGAFVLVLSPE
jgi:hypothetical protein